MATVLGVIFFAHDSIFFQPIIAGQFLHSKVKIDEEQELLFLPWRPAVPIKQRTVFKFARSEDPKE